MRLSGGELRNRRIPAPKGRLVRPTPGRVKEALFSIIGARIIDARVLDLYAGSGAIGFEALSRGADVVTFVESHRRTADAIVQTAQALDLEARARVVCALAERAVARLRGPFSFVYADPPYANDPPKELFRTMYERKIIATHALLVYERAAKSQALTVDGYRTTREERYGEVFLQFLEPDWECAA